MSFKEKRFLKYMYLLIAAFFCSNGAKADIYTVDIEMLNVKAEMHQAICDNSFGTCYKTLIIPPKEDVKNAEPEYIEVGIHFDEDIANFRFMRKGKYLFTNPRGKDYFQMPVGAFYEGKKNMDLYLPLPARDFMQDGEARGIKIVTLSINIKKEAPP